MGAWGLRGEAWRSPTHLPNLPLSRGTHRATSSKVQRAASLSQARTPCGPRCCMSLGWGFAEAASF